MHQSQGSADSGNVHPVIVASGNKLVFVSGLQPEDIHGKLVGNSDFAAQASLAFGNLGRALAAGGARPEQVCKITIYIVDYKRDEHVPIIQENSGNQL